MLASFLVGLDWNNNLRPGSVEFCKLHILRLGCCFMIFEFLGCNIFSLNLLWKRFNLGPASSINFVLGTPERGAGFMPVFEQLSGVEP